MELQDRSRLYPNLPQVSGNLVMGQDGRLQYAPLPQMPVPSAPSAPSAPSGHFSQSIQNQPVHQYAVLSPPPINTEALSAQKALNCWGRTLRVTSSVFLFVNVVGHIVWAVNLAYPPPDAPVRTPNNLMLVGRILLFIALCITGKLGLKAGTNKTSKAAKSFLKMLMFLGLIFLTFLGFFAYRKLNKSSYGKNHKRQTSEENEYLSKHKNNRHDE
jgi:heme A synthase